MMHDLKIDPENYEAVAGGRKPYEIRKADRDYKVGDAVNLREYSRVTEQYSGRSMVFRITYLTEPGTWGLPADLCVFGIQ